MSLVIEALRRVEKTDARPGSIGAFVTSYRKAPGPRRSAVPLLLGVLTGGALIFVFGTQGVDSSAAPGSAPDPGPPPARLKGAAGLPPPMILHSALPPVQVREPAQETPPPPAAPVKTESRGDVAPGASAPKATLVLQAISERDSHPIAVINDQLVKEGDRIGSVKVLHIGADSVEIILESGAHDIVRFAQPPLSPPEARPTPGPHS